MHRPRQAARFDAARDARASRPEPSPSIPRATAARPPLLWCGEIARRRAFLPRARASARASSSDERLLREDDPVVIGIHESTGNIGDPSERHGDVAIARALLVALSRVR